MHCNTSYIVHSYTWHRDIDDLYHTLMFGIKLLKFACIVKLEKIYTSYSYSIWV